MAAPLIEFPADDAQRAIAFWSDLLGIELAERGPDQGAGWETGDGSPRLGIHERGRGPGDRAALPYFDVAEMESALQRVVELGGEIIHPGERWSICRDSEGSPFALSA